MTEEQFKKAKALLEGIKRAEEKIMESKAAIIELKDYEKSTHPSIITAEIKGYGLSFDIECSFLIGLLRESIEGNVERIKLYKKEFSEL